MSNFRALRITGPCNRGLWMCIGGVWDLQTTSFEIPWFLGGVFISSTLWMSGKFSRPHEKNHQKTEWDQNLTHLWDPCGIYIYTYLPTFPRLPNTWFLVSLYDWKTRDLPLKINPCHVGIHVAWTVPGPTNPLGQFLPVFFVGQGGWLPKLHEHTFGGTVGPKTSYTWVIYFTPYTKMAEKDSYDSLGLCTWMSQEVSK